jgi:hypothetical protein
LDQPARPLEISRACRFSSAFDESPGKLKIRRRSASDQGKNQIKNPNGKAHHVYLWSLRFSFELRKTTEIAKVGFKSF